MDSMLDLDCVNQFVGLLQSRSGILIKNHQYEELKKTIVDVSAHFNLNPESLLKKISTCQENDPVFEYIITSVTIGESYFFRDSDQFEFLEHHLIPDLIAKKSQLPLSTLRIWSAGCSSGEEIYSIAMLLNERSFNREKIKVQLIGSDINCELLRRAKSGVYSEWSFRTTPEYYREKYFIKKDNRYHLHQDIKNAVQFNYLNLNNLNYPSIMNGVFALDIILCRNVFIYFDIDRIKPIMKQFSVSLCSDGFLILGASDPVIFSTEDLDRCHGKAVSCFKKAAAPLPASFTQPEEFHDSEFIIQEDLSPEIKLEPESKMPLLVNSNFEMHLNNLINENSWENAINYIDQIYKPPLPYTVELIMIKCLANLGLIQLAESRCHSLLKTKPLSSELYYLLGLCQSELNQFDAAEASFRKALYLDRDYIIAQIQLGHLLLRQHHLSDGIRLLKTAINGLNNFSEDHEVKDYPNMSTSNLKQLLRNELSLYHKDGERSDEI